MENEKAIQKKHGIISYISLLIGIICFFIVFVTPTRIANVGNLIGDYITFFSNWFRYFIINNWDSEENGEKYYTYYLIHSFIIFLYILGDHNNFIVYWAN